MTLRNQRAYERWAPTYDADPNPHTSLEYGAVLKAVSPKNTDEILDAACGTGRYVEAFRRAGAHVTGIDFCRVMLDIAQQKVPDVEFVEGDISKRLPFSDARFTKINCAQALKHLENVQPAIDEFARLLRTGGLLSFSVTHPEMDWSGYELASGPRFVLSQETDIYNHQLTDYRTALERAAFTSIDVVTLRVSEKIAHLLTEQSFEVVRDRPQIAVFRARARN